MVSVDELIETRRPGYALDQAFYSDPEVYALELERVIYRNWILAGHTSELPEPGDFVTREMLGAPVLIVRGDDGVARARFARAVGGKWRSASAPMTRRFVSSG